MQASGLWIAGDMRKCEIMMEILALIVAFFLSFSPAAVQVPAPYSLPTPSLPSPRDEVFAHAPVQSGSPEFAGPYRVTRVVDGDTLVVDIDGSATILRLIGLDTPEILDPRKPVQCFGREASQRAKALLTNQSVHIEYDRSQGMLDKYDRTLAYVYLSDGSLFNERMIAEGYGHEYTYNLPYRYQARFQAAEDAARTGSRGLWADAACAAESDRTAPAFRAAPVFRPDTAEFICSQNAYDCADFATHADAQRAYEACGGAANDVHLLDRDLDGSACEALP